MYVDIIIIIQYINYKLTTKQYKLPNQSIIESIGNYCGNDYRKVNDYVDSLIEYCNRNLQVIETLQIEDISNITKYNSCKDINLELQEIICQLFSNDIQDKDEIYSLFSSNIIVIPLLIFEHIFSYYSTNFPTHCLLYLVNYLQMFQSGKQLLEHYFIHKESIFSEISSYIFLQSIHNYIPIHSAQPYQNTILYSKILNKFSQHLNYQKKKQKLSNLFHCKIYNYQYIVTIIKCYINSPDETKTAELLSYLTTHKILYAQLFKMIDVYSPIDIDKKKLKLIKKYMK